MTPAQLAIEKINAISNKANSVIARMEKTENKVTKVAAQAQVVIEKHAIAQALDERITAKLDLKI